MTSQVIKCNNCNIVICELLAFIQNKMQVMDEEGLVRLCVTTFSAEDIEAAKSLLFESITTSKRKISRKRDGKSKRDLHDVITLLKEVDPEEVPIFVARELHKLPPVTFDHIDVTRLLKDLLLLQSELRTVKECYVTNDQFEEFKKELSNNEHQLRNIPENINCKRGGRSTTSTCLDSGPMGLPHFFEKSDRSAATNTKVITTQNLLSPGSGINESNTVMQQISVPVRTPATVVSTHHKTDKRPVEGSSSERSVPQAHSGSDKKTQSNENGNKWTLVQRKKPKSRFQGNKGKAVMEPNNKFRAADIRIPLFITNVDKQTSENDISEYILSKTQTSIVLKKINIRQEKNYNAYKILVPHHKLALFLNDNLWPEGVSFRRFVYFNKTSNNVNRSSNENSGTTEEH